MEIHQRRLAPTAGLALEDELEQAHHSYPPTAHRRHSKPTLWGPKPAGRTLAVYVALLLAYGALCWLVSTYSARVPEPVPAGAPPQLFSEGRARLHLEQLIKQIGWRQAGTRNNDVLTVNWLLEKLNAVQEEAKAIGGGSRLDIELQSGSSAYTLYFVDAYITNTYSNITNILVRVPARNKPADAYSPLLLINSHFDSGVGATGASDDGVATVACLEMVRNLVYEPPLDYDVLFLFNGAEEPLLPASHAFVTQHPLAKRVKAVVNLEAAGAGGPALAFQIGSADLAYAYASVVPYPHTMVTAAEIFQSGVIPADTDYRIFRDFGEIPGIDMAFYQNGYVYHTPLDDLDMVTPGSIQHMGGNTLALARHLTDAQASDHLLAKPRDSSSSRAFYFSLFGWCVAYSALWGFVANVAAACLCVSFSWRAIREGERSKLRQMYVGMLQATLAGVLSSVLTALVLGNVLGHPLSYFSAPWLGTTLHSAAFVLGFLLVMRRVFTAINNVHQYGKPVEDHTILNEATEELAVHAGMLFFTTISLLLTAAGVFTSWFFAAQSLFLVAARAWQLLYRSVILPRFRHATADDEIIGSGPRAQRVPAHGIPHWTETPASALFYALTVAPTALLTLPAYEVGLGMILPLLGRAGVAVPPDLVIGAITSLMALCLLVPAVPALIQAGNLRYAIRIVGVVLLVLVVVALLSFPYGAATPKRLIAQHTYHRPVQVLHKTTANGLPTTPDDQAAKIADMIAKFNAEDRSGKPDADDSFVLLGSFDYIPADVVFSGLDGPPPSFKQAEDVLYNFLPVYPFQPFMSAVQLPAAVPAGPGLFSSGRMEHPTIRVVKDEFHASTDIRTLVLSFDYTGFEISTLRLDATDSPLLEWAFSSTEDWRAGKVPHFSTPPPAARGDYFIRHIGGYGTREWVVLLRLRGLDPVRLDIAGTHLRMTPELEALSRMLPDWATSYFFYSEVTTWIVE